MSTLSADTSSSSSLLLLSAMATPGASKEVVAGGEDAGFVGQNEVDGTLVFIANDVACDAVFNGQSDGVFRQLLAFDHSPFVKVEEFVASSSVSSGTKVYTGGATGDCGGVQWGRGHRGPGCMPQRESSSVLCSGDGFQQ